MRVAAAASADLGSAHGRSSAGSSSGAASPRSRRTPRRGTVERRRARRGRARSGSCSATAPRRGSARRPTTAAGWAWCASGSGRSGGWSTCPARAPARARSSTCSGRAGAELAPDLVTAVVGGNDALRSPLPDWLRDAGDLLAALPPGAVVSTTARGVFERKTRQANAFVREQAAAHGLRVADLWAHTGPPYRGLYADGFHPNDAGYRAVGRRRGRGARSSAGCRPRTARSRSERCSSTTRRSAVRVLALEQAVDPRRAPPGSTSVDGNSRSVSVLRHLRRPRLPRGRARPRGSGRRTARAARPGRSARTRGPPPPPGGSTATCPPWPPPRPAPSPRRPAARPGRSRRAARRPPCRPVPARRRSRRRRAGRGRPAPDERASAGRCRRPAPAGRSSPRSQPSSTSASRSPQTPAKARARTSCRSLPASAARAAASDACASRVAQRPAVRGEQRGGGARLRQQRLGDAGVGLAVDARDDRLDERRRRQLPVAQGVPERRPAQRPGQRVGQAAQLGAARWPATARRSGAWRR